MRGSVKLNSDLVAPDSTFFHSHWNQKSPFFPATPHLAKTGSRIKCRFAEAESSNVTLYFF